jgi:hypothetical protein
MFILSHFFKKKKNSQCLDHSKKSIEIFENSNNCIFPFSQKPFNFFYDKENL